MTLRELGVSYFKTWKGRLLARGDAARGHFLRLFFCRYVGAQYLCSENRRKRNRSVLSGNKSCGRKRKSAAAFQNIRIFICEPERMDFCGDRPYGRNFLRFRGKLGISRLSDRQRRSRGTRGKPSVISIIS